jgi:hypothetical protein
MKEEKIDWTLEISIRCGNEIRIDRRTGWYRLSTSLEMVLRSLLEMENVREYPEEGWYYTLETFSPKEWIEHFGTSFKRPELFRGDKLMASFSPDAWDLRG